MIERENAAAIRSARIIFAWTRWKPGFPDIYPRGKHILIVPDTSSGLPLSPATLFPTAWNGSMYITTPQMIRCA